MTTTKEKLKPHKLAEFFPMMEGKEFDDLCISISEAGQKQKIVLFEGKILDGRNRYAACLKLDIEPVTTEYKGKKPLTDVVWPNNITRRQLTQSQRAGLATEMLPEIEKEAEDRKKSGVAASESDKGESTEKAAKAVGVGKELVRKAKAVKAADPKEFKNIASGVTTVGKAYKKVKAASPKKPKKAATPANAEDKKKRDAELSDAYKRIGAICGIGLSRAVMEGQRLRGDPAEAIRFAACSDEDMLRIKYLIDLDWTVKRALAYKLNAMTPGHKMRDLCERTAAQGGKFECHMLGYTITVKRDKGDKD